jgi:hypothetical protein
VRQWLQSEVMSNRGAIDKQSHLRHPGQDSNYSARVSMTFIYFSGTSPITYCTGPGQTQEQINYMNVPDLQTRLK